MPVPSRPIHTVLFDLDDTLLDRNASWTSFVPILHQQYKNRISNWDHAVALQTILTADRGGYRPKHELFTELSQQLPWLPAPTSNELESFWRQTFPACGIERKGAKSLLTDIRAAGLRLGIVTNGHTQMQSQKVNHLGLSSLAGNVIISESAGVKKPHPKIFLDAIQSLSCQCETVLFVGDNPQLDVLGPAAVGMQTAWLTLGREWPSEYPPPDHQISSLDDLRPILRLPV
jgi:putative hydrolase of the HAD superfamily